MPADSDDSQRSSRAALMMRASQISGLSPMMTSASTASRIAAAVLFTATTVALPAAVWNTAGSFARNPYCSNSTLRGARQSAMSRARVVDSCMPWRASVAATFSAARAVVPSSATPASSAGNPVRSASMIEPV
jgi:hypothetical protein